jgi:hypothetical protein
MRTFADAGSCARFQCQKIEVSSIAGESAGEDEYGRTEHCSKDDQRTVEGRLQLVSEGSRVQIRDSSP